MDEMPPGKHGISIHQDNLDKLAEVADRIHDLHNRPGINAFKTSAPVVTITQQPDVITERLKKLEPLVPTISSCRGKRRAMSPKRPLSPSRRLNQFCYYHRTYGDNAKKCRPGFKYPKVESIISKLNSSSPEDLDMTETIEPNFQQSLIIVEPVKEFGTELFQIDTRELPKELTDLAEDSSSIRGDFTNMLPEHCPTSTKRRKK
nr:hypothetical transcript [Hymenolepis microstoma]CDS34637.1 hypothetical protein HmN_000922400 [Hymenolepis microstoma]